MKSILLGHEPIFHKVFPPRWRESMASRVEWIAEPFAYPADQTLDVSRLPAETEVIFSTWGMIPLDRETLDHLPNLKAVFYAAGTVKNFVTPEFWQRGILLSHAAAANAVPVAEFTLAQILLGTKRYYHYTRIVQPEQFKELQQDCHARVSGNFRSRVGLISYGAIARLVRGYLRAFDHEVYVHDPFLPKDVARRENVTQCDLESLFRECDVVSCHTPWLPETENLIRGDHFRSMRTYGVFINTARGAVVHEREMVEALRERPDLEAILDVIHPEPSAPDNPLFQLPNATISPHMAGSMSHETARMAYYMRDEFDRYQRNEPLHHQVTEQSLKRMA